MAHIENVARQCTPCGGQPEHRVVKIGIWQGCAAYRCLECSEVFQMVPATGVAGWDAEIEQLYNVKVVRPDAPSVRTGRGMPGSGRRDRSALQVPGRSVRDDRPRR